MGKFKKRFKEGSYEQTEQGILVAWGYPNGKEVMQWIEEAERKLNINLLTEAYALSNNKVVQNLVKDFISRFYEWFGK